MARIVAGGDSLGGAEVVGSIPHEREFALEEGDGVGVVGQEQGVVLLAFAQRRKVGGTVPERRAVHKVAFQVHQNAALFDLDLHAGCGEQWPEWAVAELRVAPGLGFKLGAVQIEADFDACAGARNQRGDHGGVGEGVSCNVDCGGGGR